nr:hypothetical protein [Candidatus Paceibacterota bacterium]
AATCSVRTIATTPGAGSCTIQGTSQPEGTKLTRKNDGSPFLICDNGTWLRDPLAERGGADYQHGDACSHINFGPITIAGYSPADFGCSTTNINNRVFIGPRHGTRAHTITAKFSRLSYEVVVPNTGTQCLSYTIDWGDGTVESEPAGALGTSSCPIVLPTKYHTYSDPGSYTVSIRYTGQVPPNQTNPYTTAIRVD